MRTTILACTCLLVLSVAAHAGPIGYSVRSNVDDHLYSIDMATGAATDLGLVNFGDAEGLGFVGSTLYAIGGSVDEFWNITSPPGTKVGDTGARAGIDAGLDYDTTSGVMYNVNSTFGATSLYTVNLGTGAATLVGSGTHKVDGFAIDGAGNAYGADGVTNDGLYSVNLGTGGATFIGSFGLGDTALLTGMSFDSTGTLYMLASSGDIYTVNTGTGAATLVAGVKDATGAGMSGFEGLGIQTTGAVIPLPAAAWLGLGLLGLLGVTRRIRRRASA